MAIIKLVSVDTLANQLNSSSADIRGFIELKENGYIDDMAEMYCCICSDFEFEPEYIFSKKDITRAKNTKQIQMAFWARGRLYNSDKVLAYEFEDGLWVIPDENSEWMI